MKYFIYSKSHTNFIKYVNTHKLDPLSVFWVDTKEQLKQDVYWNEKNKCAFTVIFLNNKGNAMQEYSYI